ncbi:hypothetical protein GTB64_004533 [Salmonella enterica]|nr:hypothetical protein [Salmonella enterica]
MKKLIIALALSASASLVHAETASRIVECSTMDMETQHVNPYQHVILADYGNYFKFRFLMSNGMAGVEYVTAPLTERTSQGYAGEDDNGRGLKTSYFYAYNSFVTQLSNVFLNCAPVRSDVAINYGYQASDEIIQSELAAKNAIKAAEAKRKAEAKAQAELKAKEEAEFKIMKAKREAEEARVFAANIRRADAFKQQMEKKPFKQGDLYNVIFPSNLVFERGEVKKYTCDVLTFSAVADGKYRATSFRVGAMKLELTISRGQVTYKKDDQMSDTTSSVNLHSGYLPRLVDANGTTVLNDSDAANAPYYELYNCERNYF